MNIIEFLKKKIDNIGTICAKYINEYDEIEYLPIFYIAGSQTLPPPLEPAEEEKLIKKLSEEDNLETRQVLVERNLRLVVYIAKKFENTGKIKKKKKQTSEDKWHIDTILINRILFKNLGLKEENIIDSGLCSVCNSDIIHSFRVE